MKWPDSSSFSSAWTFQEVLICLFVVVSPLSGFAALVVSGVGIRFTWVVGCVLAATATLFAVKKKRVSLSVSALLMLLWFGWIVAITIPSIVGGNSIHLRESLLGIARFGLFVGVTVGIANLGLTFRSIRRVFRTLTFIAALASLYAVYQFFARQYGWAFAYLHLTNPSLPVTEQVGGPYYTGGVFARITSVFMEPSWFGAYLLTAIIVVAIPLCYHRSSELLSLKRWQSTIVLSLLVLAFILAYSLGAYVSLGIVIPVFVLLDWPAIRDSYTNTVVQPIAVFAVFDIIAEQGQITTVITMRIIGLFQSVTSRLFSFGNGSSSSGREPSGAETSTSGPETTVSSTPTPTSGSGATQQEEVRSSLGTRVAEIESSLDVWFNHLLTGVGINNYQFYSSSGKAAISFGYTLILAEQGIIGLGLLALFFGYVLYRLFDISGGYRPLSLSAKQVISRALFYVILTDLVNMMFRLQFHLLRFWFYVGIALAVLSLFSDSQQKSHFRQEVPFFA